MPVAPSFQAMTRLTDDPFTKNGKLYVKVKNEKTGTIREVRWYSDSEYAKAYGEKTSTAGKVPGDGIDAAWEFYWTKEGHPGMKHARGFDLGPILVIRRNRPQDENWLRASKARYMVGVGWYFASEDIFGEGATFPEDAPENFKYVFMSWEEMRDSDDRHCKRPSILAQIIDQKMTNKEWVNINGQT